MGRTTRAAMLAGVVVTITIWGLGVFLGFPGGASVITALVAGTLSALLLLAAGRRAETFHPTDPNAHLDERPDPPVTLDGADPRGSDELDGDDRG